MSNKLRKCDVCREWIDAERIAGAPRTRLCRKHAEQIAKYGGEFITVSKTERTSKPGSLKINLGGVSTRMVYNHRALERLQMEYEDEMYGRRPNQD